MPTHREMIAWATGVFEGEGSLSFRGGRPNLQIRMTDEDVLRKIQATFGGSVVGPYIYRSQVKLDPKPIYVWYAGKLTDIERVLRLMLPYLCERRLVAARAALDNLEGKPPRIQLTDREVIEVRKRLTRGESNASIARHYDVDPSCISKIKTGDRRR